MTWRSQLTAWSVRDALRHINFAVVSKHAPETANSRLKMGLFSSLSKRKFYCAAPEARLMFRFLVAAMMLALAAAAPSSDKSQPTLDAKSDSLVKPQRANLVVR